VTGVTPEPGPPLPNSIVALAHPQLFLGVDDRAVVSDQLAATLIASVALWSLREMRALDFGSRHRRRFLVPVSTLTVELRGAQVGATSLERELLNEVRVICAGPLHRAGFGVPVREVIQEWMGGLYALPFRFVVQAVTEQAKATGWYEEVAQIPRGNPVTRASTPSVVNLPRADRAPLLRSAAERLVVDWHRFLDDESQLSYWLIKTATDAIGDQTYVEYESV
jgi:hypothetical protein